MRFYDQPEYLQTGDPQFGSFSRRGFCSGLFDVGKSSFEAKRETKNGLIPSLQQHKRPYRNDKNFHLNLNFTNQIIVTQNRDEDIIIIIILATLSGDD